MTLTSQKRLAALAALTVLTVFIAANAHLVTVAFRAQPPCVVDNSAATPAKRAC